MILLLFEHQHTILQPCLIILNCRSQVNETQLSSCRKAVKFRATGTETEAIQSHSFLLAL